MSAFLVSKEHVDAMLTAGLYGDSPMSWWRPGREGEENGLRTLTRDNANDVGWMLWAENHQSVNARYRETTRTPPYRFAELAGYEPGYGHGLIVLKAIACYDYQSCEHDGWLKSEARVFCQRLVDRVVYGLPGFDGAPGWSVENGNVFRDAKRLVLLPT